MKTLHITLAALCATYTTTAQENPLLDNLSLELGYGYNLAINPVAPVSSSDVSAFSSAHAGATYHIDKVWGVRGTYMYNQFKVENVEDQKLQIHKLALEATFDITEAIQKRTTSNYKKGFAVEAHAGAGLSMGKSGYPKRGDDFMANVQIGVLPVYNIDNNWAVFADATFTQYIKQNFNFNGQRADNNGQTATFNIGVRVKLGK